MNTWQTLFTNNEFRMMDEAEFSFSDTNLPKALHSFVIDDALSESISQNKSAPVVRFWVHNKTTVLGIPDARLPHVEDAVHFLNSEGHDVIVRNSGGLAVALDAGVLNISLIIPGVKELSIYECYDMMVHFIQEMLAPYTNKVEAYEIEGSYCPGDYDLSINGRKFAGISQRRIRNSASIQIYLDVCGDSAKKADHIRTFYEIATKDYSLSNEPPHVRKEKMANLSELTNHDLTVSQIKELAENTLRTLVKNVFVQHDFTSTEMEYYQKRLKQMIVRNEPIQQMITKAKQS